MSLIKDIVSNVSEKRACIREGKRANEATKNIPGHFVVDKRFLLVACLAVLALLISCVILGVLLPPVSFLAATSDGDGG